jgi:hypothetical protein
VRAGGGNFGKLSDLAPPIDFAASFDSLEIMERVMRHFYLRIEERMGNRTDWKQVDGLMMQALTAAEKVARYRRAQLSAVNLAGDIKAKVEAFSLDELLVKIKEELRKLGPLINLEASGAAGVENRGGLTVGIRTNEHSWRSGA